MSIETERMDTFSNFEEKERETDEFNKNGK